MQHPIPKAAAIFALLASLVSSPGQFPASENPDSIVLTNGNQLHGLIVQRSPTDVTLQTAHGEKRIPRTEIARILDEADSGAYFLDTHRKGTLPPWRVLVNDLRHTDTVRSLEQIPATVIDEGIFKNVPYISFRINGDLELNIYGNPNDPAGIEVGIYGRRQNDKRLRTICREFFASYLSTREEIQALYALDPDGDKIQAGAMVLETTPADAPDAYGAFWLSVYNPKRIEKKRMSESEYAALTVPMESVVAEDGSVQEGVWSKEQCRQALAAGRGSEEDRLFVRGFYRDDAGVFRVVPFEE